MRKLHDQSRWATVAGAKVKMASLAAVLLATGLATTAGADTELGQFTLANYYTPTSPTDSTPTDPSNPLTATIAFTYLNAGPNGDNLAVAIANTSTPASSNELIRDVVFQISNNGGLLTSPLTSSATYLADAADEFDNNGTIPFAPGKTLTYPWSISASATYSHSYDLSSMVNPNYASYTINADMVGSSSYSMAGINSTAYVFGYAPALIPQAAGGSVTFDVNVPNLTSNATIQNVYIGYGQTTTAGGHIPQGGYVEIPTSEAVPEPSMAATVATLLMGAGLLARRRGRKL